MCNFLIVLKFGFSQEARSKDTVMLVDRYKYLDLMPCSDVELKLMGHPVRSFLFLVSSLYSVHCVLAGFVVGGQMSLPMYGCNNICLSIGIPEISS